MSIFSKLKFWKKEDEFDFETLAEKEIAGEKTPAQGERGRGEKSPFPEEEPESIPTPSFFSPAGKPSSVLSSLYPAPPSFEVPSGSAERDLELVNSKLDTIKALLNSLDQRMATLERSSSSAEKKQKLW